MMDKESFARSVVPPFNRNSAVPDSSTARWSAAVTTSQPWVFIGEPGKVDLLIRDRLAVATPAGADAL